MGHLYNLRILQNVTLPNLFCEIYSFARRRSELWLSGIVWDDRGNVFKSLQEKVVRWGWRLLRWKSMLGATVFWILPSRECKVMFWEDFLWYFDYNYLKNFVAFVFWARSLKMSDQHLCHAENVCQVSRQTRSVWFCGRNVKRTCCCHDNKLTTEAHNKRQASFAFASVHLCLLQGLQFVHSKSTDMVISEEGIIPSLLSPMPYNIE